MSLEVRLLDFMPHAIFLRAQRQLESAAGVPAREGVYARSCVISYLGMNAWHCAALGGGRGCLRAGERSGLPGLGWNSVSGFFPGPASQILRLLWKVEGGASGQPTGATLPEAPRLVPGHDLLHPRFAFGD